MSGLDRLVELDWAGPGVRSAIGYCPLGPTGAVDKRLRQGGSRRLGQAHAANLRPEIRRNLAGSVDGGGFDPRGKGLSNRALAVCAQA